MNYKIGLLFAGQGAQTPNMGFDFYQQYPYLENLYGTASKILGYDIKDICFSENGLMNQTLYTQPAIVVTSIAIYEVLKKEFNLEIASTLGFSLGEYSALYASGVFDLETIINLIKKRAINLDEDAHLNHGAMGAVIGLSPDEVEKLVSEFDDIFIANYNSPSQVVVSGQYDSVLLLKDKIAKLNKRFMMLNVSGAFHSKFMENASNKMYEEVKKYPYHQPKFPLYCNYNASKLVVEDIATTLKLQIKSPVYFDLSIQRMIDEGVNLFIEIGPGNVLAGLVKKINSNVKTISLDKIKDLELLRGYLNAVNE